MTTVLLCRDLLGEPGRLSSPEKAASDYSDFDEDEGRKRRTTLLSLRSSVSTPEVIDHLSRTDQLRGAWNTKKDVARSADTQQTGRAETRRKAAGKRK